MGFLQDGGNDNAIVVAYSNKEDTKNIDGNEYIFVLYHTASDVQVRYRVLTFSSQTLESTMMIETMRPLITNFNNDPAVLLFGKTTMRYLYIDGNPSVSQFVELPTGDDLKDVIATENGVYSVVTQENMVLG